MILRVKRLIAATALGLFATTVLAEPTSISGTYQLTADENWSTLPSIEVGAKIDLNGHKLTIPQFGSTAYTITDSRPRVQDDYELLEELVAPAGSFVNTGVIPNAKTRGVVTVDVHSTQEWWFGAQGAKWSDGAFHLLNNTTCTYLGYGKFNPDKVTKIPPVGNGVHTVENNGGKLYIDNVCKQTASSGSASGFGHNYPIYLFAENRAGAPATVANPVYLRSAQFYANGTTLSRNFVPARRKSDNAVGLLDLANPGVNEFYVSGNDVALTASGNATNELWKKVGELHVSVADDETVNNTAVTLSGNLKLVKEGKGSLVMGKTGQTYAGGTDVKAGTLASYPTLTKTTTMTAADSEKAKQYLGAQGSSITVRSGATFLPAGNYEYFVHPLFLDGGTVKNADISGNAPLQTENPGVDGFGSLSLTADSTVFPRADMLFSGGSNPVDLGGHELTVDGYTGSKRVFWKKNVTNGTLYLKGYDNTMFAFKASAAVTMTGVTLIDEIGLDMANAMTVSNYTAKVLWDNDFCAGSAALTVTGTFRPETRYFYGCTLADGATLDLSAQTAAWSAKSASTKYGRKDVLFADGATVTIDVGARDLAKGDKVVAWTAKPANAAGLTFRIVGTDILTDEKADVGDDGIYYTADPDEIVAAVWTGKAGTLDIGTAANWECTNAMGKVDTKGGLPGAKTDVTLAGALALDIPSAVSWKSLTAKDAALSDDCDWSGLAVPVSGKIDLNGHNLTVSQLAGDCEITDSTPSTQDDYELLEELVAPAGSFVNTGVAAQNNTRVVLSADVHSATEWWYGVWGTGWNDRAYVLLNNGTTIHLGYGDFNPKNINGVVGNGLHTIDRRGGVLYVDGTKKATATTTKTLNLTYPIYLFAENRADVPWTSPNPVYLRSAQFYADGTTLSRNFVPARRRTDNAVGLLDLANIGGNEFYVSGSAVALTASGNATNVLRRQAGELHVDVAGGAITGGATLTGTVKLVKDGEGTFTWGSGTAAASCPILVTNGVFKMGVTTADVFGNGGTITVKENGQYDLNQNGGTAPAINRTFYIEGDGPDGSGAIVNNNAAGTTGGQHLKTVYLTGDATIGGSRRIDFRGTAGTCLLSGEGHVLTVKNTGMVAFCAGDSGCKVDRIVVDGGKFQPCSDATGTLDVKECIELRNGGKLISWHATKTETYALTIPVVVSEGSCATGSDNGYFSIRDVEVKGGATLAVEKGSVSIAGTLSGSGACTGIAFGNNSCWDIAFDVNGETNKVDLSSAPTGLTKITVFCGGAEEEKTYDLAPAGTLTDAQVAAITLEVTDATTVKPLNGSRLAVEGGRLVLTVVRDTRPLIAHWTGAAGDNDIANARNWACTNLYGGVEDVPRETTDVYLRGSLGFNLETDPNWKSLTVESVRLTENCDWSAIPDFFDGVVENTTIDLNGRVFRVSVTTVKACTVTDTSADAEHPGELHVNVASGTTVNNTAVTLSGNLKLVKEGEGSTFVAAKAKQPYTGGTVIAAGTMKNGMQDMVNYTFGGNGLTSGIRLTVCEGATLDLNGSYSWGWHTITLDGGKIYDAVGQPSNRLFNPVLVLTKDSTLECACNMYFGAWITLNDHLLEVKIATQRNMNVKRVTVTDSGVLDVTGGGWFNVLSDNTFSATNANLRLNAALGTAGTLAVKGYEAVYNDKSGSGSASFAVNGVFKPTTPYFYGCTLQDGATLDLSAAGDVWSTTSASDQSYLKTVSFADNATIMVVTPDHTGKIVDWTGHTPANLGTLKFKVMPDCPGRLEKRDDGLYLRRGLMLIVR